MVLSIFFVLSELILAGGVLAWKKTEKKQFLVTWVGLLLILMNCWHVAVAGLIQLVHIPVQIATIGSADLLAGVIVWYFIKKKKNTQDYFINTADCVFLIVLAIVVGTLWLRRYGSGLQIVFAMSDPAAHFKAAMDVVNNRYVQNMYDSALVNGLWLETLGAWWSKENWYQLFMLSEVYHFALAGLVFYAVIRRYLKDYFLQIMGMILSVLYMVGYPLLSTYYGFVYLGLGVTLLCGLLGVADWYFQDEPIQKWVPVLFLALCCYGLFECYVMFVPITYIALITGVFIRQHKKENLISKETVGICLGIFLLPCILGIVYTYVGLFASRGLTVSNQIATEGGCYRDLYSNLLPFFPFALFGLYQAWKKKEETVKSAYFILILVFILVLLGLGLQGKVSSYYYYKNYHVFWLIEFLLMVYGLSCVERQQRSLLSCFGLTGVLMLGLLGTNAEAKMQSVNDLFVPTNKTPLIMDLYSFNKAELTRTPFSERKIELYQYVYKELLENQKEKVVPIVSDDTSALWFEGITDQRLEGYNYVTPDVEQTRAQQLATANYVLVLTDGGEFLSNRMYEADAAYYDAFERVYENDYGYVAKIK